MLLAVVDLKHYLFIVPLCLISIFLILVILVQRGRGGGLTGALGGMGGQSAFGTKAGDLFTRITIGVAAVWILLSMAALKVLNQPVITTAGPRGSATAPADPGADGKSTKGGATDGQVPNGKAPVGKSPPALPAGETEPPATSKGTAPKTPAKSSPKSSSKSAAPAKSTPSP